MSDPVTSTAVQNNMADAAKLLRTVLGCYPTGVTIITTRSADGRPVGLTVNSFASLSLDPPLLLWSLANKSVNRGVFRGAQHFAINVLAADQGDIAMRFANPNIVDKFEGVKLHDATYSLENHIPLLDGSLVNFVCSTRDALVTGDHTLFIGEVVDWHQSPGEPLVFHQGKFVALAG